MSEVSEGVHQQALDYIQSHHVLCLASTDTQQQPWVAPVYYIFSGGRFLFLSAAHTQHGRNMAANTKVAASIQEDYSGWTEIKGIQTAGIVRMVPTEQKEKVVQQYAEKFPIIGSDAPPEIANALDKIGWYQLIPESLYFIDNSKGLGHRSQLDPQWFVAR
ncbi:hypothetical protein AB833_07670 [Chromatiales bacterium (ex Bugula neritina AB1)]|nr:hypothetical protein AB833_07670 [Chromatiales bacterium (ex Bugula neritina AB1)]